MRDLTIQLENRPGGLTDAGEALGKAGVSTEGGGAFVVDGKGIAHFLFEDGDAARNALEAAGISVLSVREVLVHTHDVDKAGNLGKIARKLANAGVNIEVVYPDHKGRVIFVVDDMERGRAVIEQAMITE
jgi:hypothetical protein